MHRAASRHSPVLLLALFLCLPCARADDEAKRATPAAAADAVVAAAAAGDTPALEALARREPPDPWLVAEELCQRERHADAVAFAQATDGKRAAGLRAYVKSRAGKPADGAGRRLLAAIDAARAGDDWEAIVAATAGYDEPLDSVLRVEIAYRRGKAERVLEDRAASALHLAVVGAAARRLGWRGRARAAFETAGLNEYERSEWPRAVSLWNQAMTLARELEDPRGIARGLNNLGIVQRALGRYEDALASYAESLQIRRKAGDEVGVARVLNNLGNVQQNLGRYPEALESFRASLRAARALGAEKLTASALNNIGSVEKLQGRYADALRNHAAALELFRRLRDGGGYGYTLNNIGVVHLALGDYDEANARYADALELARARGDRPGTAKALLNLGIVAAERGDSAGALARYDAAVALARELGDQVTTAAALNGLGLMQVLIGDHDEAMRLFTQALAIQRAIGGKAGIANSLNNVGLVLHDMGRYEEASRPYAESLELERALGNRAGIAMSTLNLAGLRVRLGDFSGGMRLYEEAHRLAAALGNKAMLAFAQREIGVAHLRQGDYGSARAAFERAAGALAASPTREGRARLLWGMTELEFVEGRYAEAVVAAREGVALITGISGGLAEGEGAGARDFYAGLFNFGCVASIRARQPESLLWFLEQGRAASLRESVGSRKALEAALIPPDLRRRLVTARDAEQAQFAAYQRVRGSGQLKATRTAHSSWESARSEVDRIARRIQREAKAAAAVVLPRPDSSAQIRSYLGADEALVLFALTGGEAHAVVIRSEGLRVVALPPTREIRDAVDALSGGEESYVSPEAVPALRALLIAPLALGRDVKRVLISPSGRLAYVPFCLLLPGRDVACVPSGTAYGLLREDASGSGKRVLGFGDPDYGVQVAGGTRTLHGRTRPQGLPRLPATRAEVRAVADVALVGEAATETALAATVAQEDRWRAVHFACHGLVDPERPMLSSLALTADAKNDGFLTCLEILRTPVPADLVVLSACETGRGRIYKTEGIVGLARSFMFAGAPRVLCSLWKVDDEATRALMVKFYELWNGKAARTERSGSKAPKAQPAGDAQGLGAAAALRRAQRYVRDHPDHPDHPEWQHPRYWAAWVLWGLAD